METNQQKTQDMAQIGHWIETWTCYWCSICNERFSRTYKYCPNCGAKMQDETETQINGR